MVLVTLTGTLLRSPWSIEQYASVPKAPDGKVTLTRLSLLYTVELVPVGTLGVLKSGLTVGVWSLVSPFVAGCTVTTGGDMLVVELPEVVVKKGFLLTTELDFDELVLDFDVVGTKEDGGVGDDDGGVNTGVDIGGDGDGVVGTTGCIVIMNNWEIALSLKIIPALTALELDTPYPAK